MRGISYFVLTAAVALGQQGERTFTFSELRTVREINEAATVIRSTGEIRGLKLDDSGTAVHVTGDPAQIELAEWLVKRLDRTSKTSSPVPHPLDYRSLRGGSPLVRVLYFKNTESTQERNEMATVIRSLVQIPSLFLSLAAGAVVMRGTAEQADAATWVFQALDKKGMGGTEESYRVAGGGDDTIRLFSLPQASSTQRLNAIAIAVRSTTQAPLFFPYTPRRIILVRGRQELMERTANALKER